MLFDLQLQVASDVDAVQHLCERVNDVFIELSNDVTYTGTAEDQQKLYSHKRSIRQRQLTDLLKLLKGLGFCSFCVLYFYRHWSVTSFGFKNRR